MSSDRVEAVLRAEGLTAGYGKLPVIRDVSLDVGRGEVVLVVGPNGAGKSTLVKAMTGAIGVMGGSVQFDGRDVTSLSAEGRARCGVGYVPQLNDVFATLTVQENLEMGGYTLPVKIANARIRDLLDQFPQLVPLRRRTAKHISGGERKLVAVARALVSDPRLLILDEPTANLSPQVAHKIMEEVVGGLAQTGRAVLLIEQRVALALPVASWIHVLVAGASRYAGPVGDLDAESIASEFFFGQAGVGMG